jgi:hypothetical protein
LNEYKKVKVHSFYMRLDGVIWFLKPVKILYMRLVLVLYDLNDLKYKYDYR